MMRWVPVRVPIDDGRCRTANSLPPAELPHWLGLLVWMNLAALAIIAAVG